MYTATGLEDKEDCLKSFAPLVKRIAHHMMARLPSSVEVDDLIQAGMMGLLEASARYDELRGAQFETYAGQRIRGAMLDELRQSDWLPRNLRRDTRRIEEAVNRLQHRQGKSPTESEVAQELGLPLEEYQQMLFDARGVQLLYYEDFGESEGENAFFDRQEMGDSATPEQLLQGERFQRSLVEAIEELPERERMMMGLHYEQEMNLKEIGEVLGVSESRVSQIHTQAVTRLRSRLRHHR
ncbi:MAG: RNA polymerase sigma factor FliA [Betaproteobacteria bacterium]|nr:RNA polymerase sigma factor FliA [Betaproteobacteria bacterium]